MCNLVFFCLGTIFSANITDVFGVSPKESVSPYKLNQQDPLNMPPTEIYSYNGLYTSHFVFKFQFL